MALRRLFPEPGVVAVEEAVAGLGLAERAVGGRPYVVDNMVATADGRAAIEGRAGPIGDPIDRALFLRLRTQVDCVLVGAGTLRAERYGHLVRSEELRAARRAEDLDPEPLGCVLTRTMELPWDTSLWTDPASRVALYTSASRNPPPCAAKVSVHRMADAELTVERVLRSLHADHDVRSVLCEGGPTLNRELLAADCLDELFLAVEPKLAGGGDEPTIVGGPPLAPPGRLELVWILEADGALFLRYRVPRP
ncbi:MAG: dihydrofolate reductase family protein [Solirubrobacteraceae bacterium]